MFIDTTKQKNRLLCAITELTLNMNKSLQSSFEGEVSGWRKVDSGLP